MSRIRVLVVDDSALVRLLLAEIIDREVDMECVGAASDALVAREMIRKLDPDVLTLDVEMPRMDGIEFLGRLMRLRPMPVVMVSALTERGADATLRALELGAVDFVCKPRVGIGPGLMQLADDIARKIRIAAQSHVRRRGPAAQAAAAPAVSGRIGQDRVVFIGASTGGTEATRELLLGLPADMPPILITQHMPAGFTKNYAARLDSLGPLSVREAAPDEPLRPGHVYLAPGGHHLAVRRAGAGIVASVVVGEPVNRHMPSVEVLFDAAARVVGPKALGVMLTGMGDDGARAMKAMRDAGAWNICQDEASCVVFGMPREAIARGAANEVLPIAQIAAALIERLRQPG